MKQFINCLFKTVTIFTVILCLSSSALLANTNLNGKYLENESVSNFAVLNFTPPFGVPVKAGGNSFIFDGINGIKQLLFSLNTSPTITSFTPTTASAGTTVTITGTGFTGATAVSFGGVAAVSYTVVSATSMTAVVPLKAVSGNLSITTSGGTGILSGFVYSCTPTTAIITVNACGSYTWHGTTYTSNTTTATFDTINAAGCDSLTTLHLTIKTTSNPVTISGSSNICIAGGATQLSANYVGGSWKSSNTTNVPISSGGYIITNGTTNASSTIKYYCGTDSATLNFSYRPFSTTSNPITGPTSVCQGSTIQLADNALSDAQNILNGTTAVWSVGNTGRGTITQAGVLTGGSPGASANVQYTLTNNLSCSQTLTYSVLIPTVTTPVITGPTSVCQNSSVQLSASLAGVSNTWSVANSGRGSITSSGLLTGGTPNANAIVNYKYTDINGCTSSVVAYNVYVYPKAGTGTATATACGSYFWNGTTYSASGNYAYHSFNANGCDSTTNLTLTIKPLSTSTTTASICAGSSYAFNGTAYSVAGTYVAHLTNSVGCDSAASLILTIKPVSTSTTIASICPGSSYLFNGTNYSSAGTYVAHLTNSVGCDSAASLVLVILPTSTSTTTASICPGDSYTFNGSTYTSAGTYVAHLTNSVGCDSVASLVLSIKSTSISTTTASICPGDSYTFNGISYTNAGTYTAHLTNSVGCDSAASLVLTIKPISTSTTTSSICLGASYTFNGSTYTTEGTYIAHLTNSVGCDSAATLVLSVKSTSTSTTNASICPGSTYIFNGNTYTNVGTYTVHLTNSIGCDSAANLVLTFNATSTSTTTKTACGSYTWNGTTYTQSGSYNYHTTNSIGCDSTATLVLTIQSLPTKPTVTASGATTLCNGNSVVLSTSGVAGNAIQFNGSGSNAYTQNNGALNFYNQYTFESYINLQSYKYETFIAKWDDDNNNRSWMVNMGETGDGSKLCVVQSTPDWSSGRHIQWNSGFTPALNTWYHIAVTYDGSYIKLYVNGSLYNQTSYSYSLTPNNINLILGGYDGPNNGVNAGANDRFLNGKMAEVRVWNYTRSQSQIQANMSSSVPANSSGLVAYYRFVEGQGNSTADATTYGGNLTLTNGVTWETPTSAPISGGYSSYAWSPSSSTTSSTTATTSGNYFVSVTGTNGCTNTSTPITVTVNQPSTSTTYDTICSNTSVIFNGTTYNTTGTYVAHLTNSVGCDSAATLVLTVKQASSSTTSITICSGSSYTFNGTTYNKTGTYTTHLTNKIGCDSAASLVLNVDTIPIPTLIASGPTAFCNGSSVTLYPLGATGSVSNAASFDGLSNYMALPTINNITAISLWVYWADPQPESYHYLVDARPNYPSYIGDGFASNWTKMYVNGVSQPVSFSSIPTNQWVHLYVESNASFNDNLTFFKRYTAGVGNEALLCKASNLAIWSVPQTQAQVIASMYSSYPVNTTGLLAYYTFNQTSGTTVADATGNGHNATLPSGITWVTSVPSLGVTYSNYQWTGNGATTATNNVTTSGNYAITVTDGNGCSNTSATTTVTVKNLSTSYTYDTICNGASVTFNGSSYNATGTYVAHLTNSVGCDSAATLVLTVKPTSASTTNVRICYGTTYTFNGVTYDSAGTYVAHLTNSVGCDSVATLVLGIAKSTTTKTICAGSTYTFNGLDYSQSGTYIAHLTSSLGCDSAAILALTVDTVAVPIVTANGPTTYCNNNLTTLSTSVNGVTGGGTITFNGSNYINVPDNSSLNFGTSTDFTYEAWVQTSVSQPGYAGIIIKGAEAPFSQLVINGTHIGAEIYSSNGFIGVQNGLVGTTNLIDGKWHHLAMSVSRITNTATLYVDGKPEAVVTNSVISGNLNNLGTPLLMGVERGTNQHFTGNMSEARVWNTARTQAQIQANMYSSVSPSTSGLVAYYQFNEGNGTIAKDATTNRNNGTLINNPTWLIPSTSPVGGYSYLWSDTETSPSVAPTTSGNYSVKVTDGNGCSNTSTTTIVVVKATTTATLSNTVYGSYTWHGTTYTQSGNYTFDSLNVAGCDSLTTLNLTVIPKPGAFTYNTPNAFPVNNVISTLNPTFVSTGGAPTSYSISPTLPVGLSFNTTTGVISGTPTVTNTATTYTVTATNPAGNSSTTVSIGVCAPTTAIVTITACGSYTWHGTTYTSSTNIPTFDSLNATGCDSLTTLHLTILKPTTATLTATACGSYLWHGATYTTSGAYTFDTLNAVGCDSLTTLNLSISPLPNQPTITASGGTNFCSGSTVTLTAQNSNAGNALTFNGSNQYITVNDYSAFNFSTNVTVECWAKLSRSSADQTIISRFGANGYVLLITIYGTNRGGSVGEVEWGGEGAGWSPNNWTISNSTVDNGQWHHIACVYNGSTRSIYIDGQLSGQSYVSGSIQPAGTSYPFTIGYTTLQGRYLNGSLDELRLWNVAKTQSQIQATMNSTVPTNSTGLVGYYNFDEGSGSTVNDVTGSHTGTLYGPTWLVPSSAPISAGYTGYVWTPGGATTSAITAATSGNYTVTVSGANGCTNSSTPVAINVKATSTSTTTASICSGTSYLFNGSNYTASGTYVAHLTNSLGCDSAASLVLTVKPTSTSTTNIRICYGGSYTFNGTTYTASGTYTSHLTNSLGCDSAATLILTVAESTTTQTICAGASYTFNGSDYNQSGTYIAHLTSSLGCDSAAILVLTVDSVAVPSVTPSVPTTYCSNNVSALVSSGVSNQGLSYLWTGGATTPNFTPSVSGAYTVTITDINGCSNTSAATAITINATSTSTTNVSICPGSSYLFNGTAYTNVGTYTAHLTNSVGCDSAAILVLTFKATSSSTTTKTACGSFSWNGTTYTQSGTYNYHSVNSVGCDSAATLVLTIDTLPTKPTITATGPTTICNGGSVSLAAPSTNNSGTAYTGSNLVGYWKFDEGSGNTVADASGNNLNGTFVNGSGWATSGAFSGAGSTGSFNNSNYIDVPDNNVINSMQSNFTIEAWIYLNGTKTDNTIIDRANYNFLFQAQAYGRGMGFYNPADGWSFSDVSIPNNTWMHVACTWDQASHTLLFYKNGVLINTFNRPHNMQFNAGDINIGRQQPGGCNCNLMPGKIDELRIWNTTRTQAQIQATMAQALTVTSVAPTYTYNWSPSTGLNNTVGKSVIASPTSSTTYILTDTGSNGCTNSTSILVTVNQPTTSTTNASICNGSFYSFNGTNYTTAGTYIKHLTNSLGCDSTATLVLNVLQPTTAIVNATACNSYTWHGTTYTASGNYTFDSLNSVGCDSLTTLALTILQPTTATVKVTSCDSYTWHGTTYTVSGSYTFDSINVAGCDSLTTLKLTIKQTVTPSLFAGITTGSQVICDGGSLTIAATPTNGGSAPTYIWYNGSNVISGQTSATYTYSPIAGNRDTITVKLVGADNICQTVDTALSNLVTPYVTPFVTPSVTLVSTQTGTVCSGKSVTFSATISKFGPSPSYQWFNGSTAITGITTKSYYSYTPTAGNTDAISVVVSGANNACQTASTAQSNSITPVITQTLTPSVSIVPSQSGAVCGNTVLTFTAISTNGGSAPTYQWYKGITAIDSANSSSYSYTPTVGNTDAINVKMTANNACQPISLVSSRSISPAVVVPVTPSVSIISNQTGTVCSGKAVTFSATVSKFGSAPQYQWFNGSTAITAATTKSYYTYTPTVGNSDVISVVVSGANNACQTASTASSNGITPVITQSVTPSVSITSSQSGTLCSGSSVTFSAAASNGGSTPTYQWYTGSTAIAGATTDSYSYTPAPGNKDAVNVKLTSNNTCQTATIVSSKSISPVIAALVTPAVTITSSQTGTVCSGKTVTFSATISKFGSSPQYQWFNGSTALTGVTTQSYYSYKPTVGNTDTISVVVTGANNACQTTSTAQSNSITPVISVPVTPTVSIVANPGSNVTAGTKVVFSVASINGATVSKYQWYRGSTAISGATAAVYTYTPANNEVISLKVTGPDSTCQLTSTATSNSITMKVTAPVYVISENRVATESVGIQASLYPNPSNGNATLKLTGVTKSLTITVRSILGNTLHTIVASKDGEVKLPAQSLASGLYIVSINDGITRKDIKWVKN